jgi:hypothetical protein
VLDMRGRRHPDTAGIDQREIPHLS